MRDLEDPNLCPQCDRRMQDGDGRYETNGRGEPSYLIHGCKTCLKGRNVHRYVGDEARLVNERDERRISEAREGCDV